MYLLEDRKVITKKSHKCWGCTREYPAGTSMQVVVSTDGSTISRVYWCEDCQRFLDTLDLWDREDGFCFGDLLNDEDYRQKVEAHTPRLYGK